MEKGLDFSKNFRRILMNAKISSSNDTLTPVNFLVGILSNEECVAYDLLEDNIDVEALREKHFELLSKVEDSYHDEDDARTIKVRMTGVADSIVNDAREQARVFNTDIVSSEHLLLSLIKFNIVNGITYDDALEYLKQHEKYIETNNDTSMSNDKELMVEKFSTDLTKLAKESKLDPVVGREDELRRIATILSRRKKNNPVLVGNPGVGKTAVVEGLAQNIINGKVPVSLQDMRILSLNMSSVVAGTKYRGEFEERMKKIMDELKSMDNIIVYIDEIHTIMGAGGTSGSMDAANMLKPALARGEINCIGSTTFDEYRNIEKDGALDRRFQKVVIDEPTFEETRQILYNLKERYEEHHDVKYTSDAIEACLNLSNRYITDRFFPDKAIDALDEAGSSVKISQINPELFDDIVTKIEIIIEDKLEAVREQRFEDAHKLLQEEKELRKEKETLIEKHQQDLIDNPPEVTSDDVALSVSIMTGIPSKNINENDVEKLVNLSEELKKYVIGQDEAIEKIAKAVLRNSAGLGDTKRPIGAFLFTGSTGVGKTYLTKKLAEKLFTSEKDMIRLDMSEFMEKHSVSRLVGSPPGYVGYDEAGQLTEAVRRNPYSIVLFDEIEKAHNDVTNILLQVLEDGILTDSQGRTVNFKNTLIIMTSNVGSAKAQMDKGIGFNSDSNKHAKSIVNKELKSRFRPEFLNRIDEIIHFNSLSKDNIKQIISIELNKTIKSINEQGIEVEFDDTAMEHLFTVGWDEKMGARPLKRAIQNLIENEMAFNIMTKKYEKGDTIIISHTEGDEELTFNKKEESIQVVDTTISSETE